MQKKNNRVKTLPFFTLAANHLSSSLSDSLPPKKLFRHPKQEATDTLAVAVAVRTTTWAIWVMREVGHRPHGSPARASGRSGGLRRRTRTFAIKIRMQISPQLSSRRRHRIMCPNEWPKLARPHHSRATSRPVRQSSIAYNRNVPKVATRCLLDDANRSRHSNLLNSSVTNFRSD